MEQLIQRHPIHIPDMTTRRNAELPLQCADFDTGAAQKLASQSLPSRCLVFLQIGLEQKCSIGAIEDTSVCLDNANCYWTGFQSGSRKYSAKATQQQVGTVEMLTDIGSGVATSRNIGR